MMENEVNNIDVKRLLRQFYFGNDKSEIEQYYKTASFLELFGIERQETCHTRFLKWLFDSSELAVKNLLYLVLKWSEIQNKVFNVTLSQGLYEGSVDFNKIDASAEAPSQSCDYGRGSIDIVVDCLITIDDTQKHLNIVLENKIYSPETTKDVKGVTKFQTDSYFEYYSQFHKDDINVFVFLKPVTTYELSNADNETIKKWCSNDQFTIINYQELVDFVLTPLISSDYTDDRMKMIVKEYIRSLGKTTEKSKHSNKQILAMGEEEKQLLVKFYLNNRDLIYAALSAVVDSNNPDISQEDKDNASKWSDNEKEIRKSGSRTKFTITYNNSEKTEPMFAKNIVKRFAEFLMSSIIKTGKTIDKSVIDKINERIKKYSCSKETSRVYFSDDNSVFGYYSDKRKQIKTPRCVELELGNKKYYVTDQWSPNVEDGDWQSFMKKVNEEYKNSFMIELA